MRREFEFDFKVKARRKIIFMKMEEKIYFENKGEKIE